jgi:hypothetical protein
MKIGKVWLVGLMGGIFLGCLTFNIVHAQNMNIWEGTWFKLALKTSGYNIDYPGISPYNDTEKAYVKLWKVDEGNEMLYSDIYTYEDGAWNTEPVNFNFLGHHNWEFIAWYYEESDYVDNGVNCTRFLALTLLFQGTIKQETLISASLKSLGGTQWRAVWNQPGYEHYNAHGITVTGSLINASKVPVPADKILH